MAHVLSHNVSRYSSHLQLFGAELVHVVLVAPVVWHAHGLDLECEVVLHVAGVGYHGPAVVRAVPRLLRQLQGAGRRQVPEEMM